jgi:hypothetical protein
VRDSRRQLFLTQRLEHVVSDKQTRPQRADNAMSGNDVRKHKRRNIERVELYRRR